jgi:hypothetical protein
MCKFFFSTGDVLTTLNMNVPKRFLALALWCMYGLAQRRRVV